jgi:predicted metal-dependent hydrolase
MIQDQISFGSKNLKYQLTYTNRKTLGIQVHPFGQIKVIAPIALDTKTIKIKVRQKAPWILRQLNTFNKYQPGTPQRRFVNGESHLYLGRQYRLKLVKDSVQVIKAYRGHLWIHSPNPDKSSLQKQLEKWYVSRAKGIFHQVLDSVFPKFKRYLKVQPPLLIRKMSTRWGSCTPSGRIILHPELIKAPKGCIEYVIIHELCHLVHHNHAKAFYLLLNRMMPDWEKRKDKLEKSQI